MTVALTMDRSARPPLEPRSGFLNQGPRNPRRGPIQFPLNGKSEAACSRRSMSAIGCKADVTFWVRTSAFDPKQTCADSGISEMQRLNIAIPPREIVLMRV